MRNRVSPLDHILLIGFGGPERPEEVRPFIEQVTRGARIPEARLREVEHHYEQIGGRSPYNDHVRFITQKLQTHLRASNINLPVFLGMRNWHPFLNEVMPAIQSRGLKRGVGIVLAPHRSEASFERYVRSVGDVNIGTYEYLGPWHAHPLFIQAQAERIRELVRPETVPTLLFTAHSIPVSMAEKSRYAQEFEESSQLIAQALGVPDWSMAYQSRSGKPSDPWLGPDVSERIHEIAGQGKRTVVIAPVGFVCDNAEILYDLDIKARKAAEQAGLEYRRAATAWSHPAFIAMLAQQIQDRLARTQPIRS